MLGSRCFTGPPRITDNNVLYFLMEYPNSQKPAYHAVRLHSHQEFRSILDGY